MTITKRVSVTGIISIPAPPFKRGGHFVASSLQFCCRWRKNRLRLLVDTPRRVRLRVALSGSCFAVTGKSRGFARSGALGQPVRVMVLRACLGVDLSKPEWLFVRYPHRRKADGCGGKDSVEWGHGH